MPGKSQYLWGGKEKEPLLEQEIGKAKGFVFHPQTSAMQQVELSPETPSKPTALEAALGKQNLKGPSVLAHPIPALEGEMTQGCRAGELSRTEAQPHPQSSTWSSCSHRS